MTTIWFLSGPSKFLQCLTARHFAMRPRIPSRWARNATAASPRTTQRSKHGRNGLIREKGVFGAKMKNEKHLCFSTVLLQVFHILFSSVTRCFLLALIIHVLSRAFFPFLLFLCRGACSFAQSVGVSRALLSASLCTHLSTGKPSDHRLKGTTPQYSPRSHALPNHHMCHRQRHWAVSRGPYTQQDTVVSSARPNLSVPS